MSSSTLELLLQRRALHKYHSPGLWTNTCCSHPRIDESVIVAGQRRLQEEMGFKTGLKDLGWFKYNAHFPNGLSEHEIDHVLIGELSDATLIIPNPDEVMEYKWMGLEELSVDLKNNPQHYTQWLALALEFLRSKRWAAL